jgi:hypothetical protein
MRECFFTFREDHSIRSLTVETVKRGIKKWERIFRDTLPIILKEMKSKRDKGRITHSKPTAKAGPMAIATITESHRAETSGEMKTGSLKKWGEEKEKDWKKNQKEDSWRKQTNVLSSLIKRLKDAHRHKPFTSAQEAKQRLKLEMSVRTVQRVMKKGKMKFVKGRKRVFMNEGIRRRRFDWAKTNVTEESVTRRGIFCDEKLFYGIGPSIYKKRWKTEQERKKSFYNQKPNRARITVWGAIGVGFKSSLHLHTNTMNADEIKLAVGTDIAPMLR